MKKILAILLLIVLTVSLLISCNADDGKATKIKIGALSGPTGMGMAKMINDNGLDSDKYSFTVFNGPEPAKNAFIAGDVDAICFPTNTAANLYKMLEGDLYVAAINCLGSLYLLSDSTIDIKDIKDLEGKTVYASVPSSTTGAIVEHILKENGVNATVSFEYNGETLAEHEPLCDLLSQGKIDLAILPEPKATVTMVQNPDLGLSIDLNLSGEWEMVSDESEPLTMGCIIFRKSFVEKNKELVDSFLREYESSIQYINNKENNEAAANMIATAGILPKAAIAKRALNNLYGSIVYLDGAEMKTALKSFYEVIGMAQPEDGFYYEG